MTSSNKSEIAELYQNSSDERDFFQRYFNQIDAPLEHDKELREIVLNDAKSDGKHLFHLSYKTINGNEYLFVDSSSGSILSPLPWGPFKLPQLILLTQDLPTIKYLISDGFFDDYMLNCFAVKRMILYTLNLSIIHAFEYKYGRDIFDDKAYSTIYPYLCFLLDYMRVYPALFEYHRDNMNTCLSILSLYHGINAPEIHELSNVRNVFLYLLSDDVFNRMNSDYRDSYDFQMMPFDNWRKHKLEQYENQE